MEKATKIHHPFEAITASTSADELVSRFGNRRLNHDANIAGELWLQLHDQTKPKLTIHNPGGYLWSKNRPTTIVEGFKKTIRDKHNPHRSAVVSCVSLDAQLAGYDDESNTLHDFVSSHVAADELDVEAVRTFELGEDLEALADVLRMGGAAGLADKLNVTQRRAQQLLAGKGKQTILERWDEFLKSTKQTTLFGEAQKVCKSMRFRQALPEDPHEQEQLALF